MRKYLFQKSYLDKENSIDGLSENVIKTFIFSSDAQIY